MAVPNITLNDGTAIPQLGFGTWQVPDDVAETSVATALAAGYRHIDTAAIYGNEEGVGRALAASGIPRDELFVTTKLWNDKHAKDDARKAIETSLTKLGLDHVDLYLIHWPATKFPGLFVEAWDAMQEFKAEGLTRSIGVSNFNTEHLDALHGATPAINQIEMHPTFGQHELRESLLAAGIRPEAWSPLGQSKDLENPVIAGIAAESGKTPAQVIIRWHLQLGTVVIPKSVTPSRITSNFDVFDFELSDDQVARITAVDTGTRLGGDPLTM